MTETVPHAREPARVAWIVAVLLAAGAFGVRADTAADTGFVCEDALITCRYAENLAAGHGFVYNPGQKVLGTTTPLYTLVLALAGRLGLSVVKAAVWIGVAADSLVLLLVVGGLRRVLAWPGRIVFAGAYLWLASGSVWVGSGMETGLYVLSVAGALAGAAAGRERTAFVMAGVATLLRIDGGLVLVALVVQALSMRRLPVRGVVAYGLTAGGWFAFSLAYFGSLLPNSIAAKQALTAVPGFGRSPAEKVAELMLFSNLDPSLPALQLNFHFVAMPLALAGVGFALRDARLRAIPVWVASYLAFFLYAGMEFPWYFIPFQFGLLLLAAVGAGGLLGWLARALPRGGAALRYGGAGGLAALGLVLNGLSLWNEESGWRFVYRCRADYLHRNYRQAAELIKHFTTPGVTIYTGEIGYVGYYSGYPILDSVGIVSPEVIPFNREGRVEDVLKRFKPAVAVMSQSDVGRLVEKGRWFRSNYLPVDVRHFKRIYVRIEAIPTVVKIPELRERMLGLVQRGRGGG